VVETHYDWDVIGKPMLEAYSALLERSRP
jgi:hypothetical protein